jgi:predicted P-loop ATPase
MNPSGDNTSNNDDTGARRYWAIKCTRSLDIQRLILERDQLWAEAYLKAQTTKLMLSEAAEQIAKDEQESRTSKDDAYTLAIRDYLDRPDMKAQRIEMTGITSTALDIPIGQVHKGIETRVGIIMRRCGYKRSQDHRGYFYVKVNR